MFVAIQHGPVDLFVAAAGGVFNTKLFRFFRFLAVMTVTETDLIKLERFLKFLAGLALGFTDRRPKLGRLFQHLVRQQMS